MRLKHVIAAPKTDILIGKWKSGKVPKASFPVGRKAYGLARSYGWCIISFKADDERYRILIVLNESKQIYQAVLGKVGPKFMSILCSYEFHASEPGWHCHADCGDIGSVPVGAMRSHQMERLPRGGNFHRNCLFNVTKESAVHLAIDQFNVEEKGPLL